MTVLSQSLTVLLSVRPRVMTRAPGFGRPIIWRTTYFPSAVCCLSSILSTSVVRPLTSVTFGISIPSTFTRNPLADEESSASASAMVTAPTR